MAELDSLAEFAADARYEKLSHRETEELKLRVLDSLAVAVGATTYSVPKKVRAFIEKTGNAAGSHLIGGGTSSPAHAAFYNSALVRFLDFNDSFFTKGETFHPSDAIGGLLAFADYSDASGKELLAAIALSYQIQATLSELAPVRAKGFDHTVQLAYASAAAMARLLRLSNCELANAIAISGTTNNSLRVTRTGKLSHWKGLAAPYTVFGAANAALLAAEGITGPHEIFEGNKGFKESISGPFAVDWKKIGLSAVSDSFLKKFNAEIHSQSTLEAALALKTEYQIRPETIRSIDIEIFDVAYHIIGGGEEGRKDKVQTKEEADHSLPYLVTVALLDDEVMPPQFEPERINAPDVQALLRRIRIRPSSEFSRRFPEEMPVRIKIEINDGAVHELSLSDYEGFRTRPMTRKAILRKFERLSHGVIDESRRQAIVDRVDQLEKIQVRDLMTQLSFK